MDRTRMTCAAAGIALSALLAGCTGGQGGMGGEEGQVPPAPPPAQPPQPPQPPPGMDPAAATAALQQQLDQALKQRPITFQPNNPSLTDEGRQTTSQAAELAKSAPQELRFEVTGFVANTGRPTSADQQLSQQRAQTVADQLVQAGVPADRVEAVGQGAAQATSRATGTPRSPSCSSPRHRAGGHLRVSSRFRFGPLDPHVAGGCTL